MTSAKNIMFSDLYGSTPEGRYGFVGWAPSVVDRLAALTDPELARRIEEADNPGMAARRIVKELSARIKSRHTRNV